MAILATRTQREKEKDHAEAEMEQRELTIYVKARCQSCWRAKRLLRRRSYVFKVIDVSGNDGPRNWLVEATGTKSVPQMFLEDLQGPDGSSLDGECKAARKTGDVQQMATLLVSGRLLRSWNQTKANEFPRRRW